jgi:hypothetical protein
MFGGHVMSFGHVFVPLQSITQTPLMQVPFVQPSSHSAGASGIVASEVAIAESGVPSHVVSGAAHQPSALQTWPPTQSFGLAHDTVQSRTDGA